MKIQLFSFAFVSTLAFQVTSFASSYSETRFTTLIGNAKTSLANVVKFYPDVLNQTAEQQAETFVNSSVRASAFSLESLALLYRDYPVLKTRMVIQSILQRAKRLEDLVGNYDKFRSHGKPEQAQAAADSLASEFKHDHWIDSDGQSLMLDGMIEQIKSAEFLEDDKDREYVISGLAGQISLLKDTNYDMDYLEGGLHEFRRQVRWFGIFGVALGGLLQYSDVGEFTCKQKQLNFKDTDSGRFPLPNTPVNVKSCVVTRCLYEEVMGVAGEFGILKDQAEPIVIHDGLGDSTPPEIAVEAKIQYNIFKSSGVLEGLYKELEACK